LDDVRLGELLPLDGKPPFLLEQLPAVLALILER
jgi:hypothetical protein